MVPASVEFRFPTPGMAPVAKLVSLIGRFAGRVHTVNYEVGMFEGVIAGVTVVIEFRHRSALLDRPEGSCLVLE